MEQTKGQAVLIALLVIFLSYNTTHAQPLIFSKEEQEYLAKGHVLTAASIDGAAPLHYLDKGEIKGIAIQVLDQIAEMTGLKFQYKLYRSIEEVYASKPNLIFGITEHYAREGITLSEPYLQTETILFINSKTDPDNLKNKRYTSIKGGTLPPGVKEENVLYSNSREESLDFVETGKADYGYGNLFSVAFYTIRNAYKNIVIVPSKHENRNYSIGLPEENPILLSVLNKAIANLDESHMQNVILEAAASAERNISLQLIIQTYGIPIISVMSLVLTGLLVSVVQNLKANNQLKVQNKRYELLANISNEFFFEYFPKSKRLELTSKLSALFDVQKEKEQAAEILKDALHNLAEDEATLVIKLPLGKDSTGTFRAITARILGETGQTLSIIGKLINISEEAAEKERLILNAQLDGVTGLYNAATTEALIRQNMDQRKANSTDALILIDCDKLKDINDTYGHLAGNEAIFSIADTLLSIFRQTDIIGRIGGDEFSVYIQDVPNSNLILEKCRSINRKLKSLNPDFPLTVSIGIAFLGKEESYEALFERADGALYQAKKTTGELVIAPDLE